MDVPGLTRRGVPKLLIGNDPGVMILRIAALVIVVLTPLLCAEKPAASPDPKISSIYPLGGQPGQPYEAAIRGKNLKGARSIWFPAPGVRGRVIAVDSLDTSN